MLVKIKGKRYEEKLVTTSLKVAEVFGKEHKDVLESIRNLAAENSAARFFKESTYKNRGKEYPMYEMDLQNMCRNNDKFIYLRKIKRNAIMFV